MVSVIYEDEAVLIVHKKSGVAVQTRRAGEKDMESCLKNYRAKKGEEPYIGLVHRLDQPVEGVMVFAKTPGAASNLSRQAADGRMEKYYRAVAFLQPDEKAEIGTEHTLTDYLLKDGKNNCSVIVEKNTPGAKKAVLSYSVLRQGGRLAEVGIKLFTGRHHQIRAQLSHAGLPLVGDRKYGSKEAVLAALGNHIALCAAKIVFFHPETKKKLEFSIEPKNPIFDKI